jgi:hypothetical protein
MSNDCFCTKTYQCLACERKEQIKDGNIVPSKIPECGTRAGYNRHLRLKEETCPECRVAQKESVTKWQQLRKENVA